jgi:hypothetical protein
MARRLIDTTLAVRNEHRITGSDGWMSKRAPDVIAAYPEHGGHPSNTCRVRGSGPRQNRTLLVDTQCQGGFCIQLIEFSGSPILSFPRFSLGVCCVRPAAPR